MDYFLGMFWAIVLNGFLLFLFIYGFVGGLEAGGVWAICSFVINIIIIYIINKKNRLMARGWSLILGLGVGIFIIIFFIGPIIIRSGGY